MKKTLLLSAVTLVTLGISSISYGECRDSGDWVCFNPLPDLTYDKEPDASCMEMICRQGCVENIKTGDGVCCPVPTEGTNCLDEEYNEKGCLIKKKLTCPTNKPVCQSDGTCGCPAGQTWNGSQCCLDVGCGCGVALTTEGCCPGVQKGCDGICGSGKVNTGCGCGVYDRTPEGCCPGVVKGCDGVCGSGKVNTGCGCGVYDRTPEGCCPGQVKGCDGICGSGKVNTGCGCGVTCPTCSGSYEQSYQISQPWQNLLAKTYTHTVRGDSGCKYKVVVEAECVDDGLNITVNGSRKAGFPHCGFPAPVCAGKPLSACSKITLNNIKGGDVIKLILSGIQSGVTEFKGKLMVYPQ